MGFVAVVLASVNIFGGFIVTQRMLAMFKKKRNKGSAQVRQSGQRSPISSRRSASSWRCAACRSPVTSRGGNLYGIAGMAIAIATTLASPASSAIGADPGGHRHRRQRSAR